MRSLEDEAWPSAATGHHSGEPVSRVTSRARILDAGGPGGADFPDQAARLGRSNTCVGCLIRRPAGYPG